MRIEAVKPPLLVGGESEGAVDPDRARAPATGFEQALGKLVDATHADQVKASAAVDALAKGASDDLHGTMISMKEAEISLKLVGTVRNKLLDAFHELWRINV